MAVDPIAERPVTQTNPLTLVAGAISRVGRNTGSTASGTPFGLTDLHMTQQTNVVRQDMQTNPPFDIRAQAARPDGRGPKFRGRIILVKRAQAPGQQFALNFLWNPGAISATYGFQQNAMGVDSLTEEQTSITNLVSTMDVGFQLMFNRQYECHQDANSMGVLEDVAALERMLGAFQGGALQSVPVQVIFGGVAGLRLFAFTGIFSAVNIRYLLFSQRMIPTVAQIDVTLSRTITGNTPTMPPGGVGGGGTPVQQDVAQMDIDRSNRNKVSRPGGNKVV